VNKVRVGVSALVAVAALVACRSPSSSPGASSTTVVLNARDSGRTVSLDPGTRLVIDLGGRRSEHRWGLVRYPRRALKLMTNRAATGKIVFEAKKRGRGHIVAIGLSGPDLLRCGAANGATARCPLRSADGGRLAPRPGAFVITVEVG
jgi:hypothetical protein